MRKIRIIKSDSIHDYAAYKMESPSTSAARRLKEITPHPAFRRMRRGVPI